MTDNTKIFVGVVGARPKFEDWIANRGGVQVWDNVNLSTPKIILAELSEDWKKEVVK